MTAEGAGVRVHLREDLLRFAEELAAQGHLSATPEEREALVDGYIARTQSEVARLVARYRTRVRRSERQTILTSKRPNLGTSECAQTSITK